MSKTLKRLTAAAVMVAAFAVPVALSGAGTPTTVKLPLERDSYCSQGFSGKRSPSGYATITRLKNGDLRITVSHRGIPGSTDTIYPFSNTPTACTYYESGFFNHQPMMKLDPSGQGSISFTFTPNAGDTDIGVEVYNNKAGGSSYDVTATAHL